MTDTGSSSNREQPTWRLLGVFAATNLATLMEAVTEAIDEFNLLPAQLVRIHEALDQTLDRAKRNAAVDELSAPVRIRILASVELVAGQACGLFLVAKQESESVSGAEGITQVVDLFIYRAYATRT